MIKRSIFLSGCFSVLLAGSAIAGTLTRGIELTGGENTFTRVSLTRADNAETAGEIRLRMSVEDAKSLKGYGFTLQFDQSRYEFVETRQVNKGFLAGGSGDAPLFVSSAKNPGEIVVGGMAISSPPVDGTGDLVEFVFRTFEDPLPNDFQVLEGVLVDLAGNVDQVVAVEIGRLDLRPEDYGLDQNMPNPFNPATTINYQIPDAGRVKLVVYNLLGQEVRTLVDMNMEAGFHNILWDGANDFGRQVASGVYIYRMTSNDFSSTRRMMLLK